MIGAAQCALFIVSLLLTYGMWSESVCPSVVFPYKSANVFLPEDVLPRDMAKEPKADLPSDKLIADNPRKINVFSNQHGLRQFVLREGVCVENDLTRNVQPIAFFIKRRRLLQNFEIAGMSKDCCWGSAKILERAERVDLVRKWDVTRRIWIPLRRHEQIYRVGIASNFDNVSALNDDHGISGIPRGTSGRFRSGNLAFAGQPQFVGRPPKSEREYSDEERRERIYGVVVGIDKFKVLKNEHAAIVRDRIVIRRPGLDVAAALFFIAGLCGAFLAYDAVKRGKL